MHSDMGLQHGKTSNHQVSKVMLKAGDTWGGNVLDEQVQTTGL
jgi:hypothetical protein